MRLVVQRVISARVEVAGEVVGAIDRPGLLILAGVTNDQPVTVRAAGRKVWTLRILDGEKSCQENAPILVVSQFTLYADLARAGVRRGARQRRAISEPLIEAFVSSLRLLGAEVATGVFGADMQVWLTNDGPANAHSRL